MAAKIDLSKEILNGLEEWASYPAHSSGLLDFYRKLLTLQAEAEESTAPSHISLTKTQMDKRLLAGTPLIRFDDLELNWELVNTLFRRIASTLAEYPEILGKIPADLSQPDFELSRVAVEAWFDGRESPAASNNREAEPFLMATLIHQTMRPFLIGYAQSLKESFDQEKWRRGYCPVCGRKPELAYLEKEAGARWLLCSACTTEWLFQRVGCPYCGNTEHKSLSFLTDDDSFYRLYLCDKCHGYLKAIDLRKRDQQYILPLLALTTVNLDEQAQAMGYHREA